MRGLFVLSIGEALGGACEADCNKQFAFFVCLCVWGELTKKSICSHEVCRSFAGGLLQSLGYS